jgi:predicted transcriptional regulator
LTTGIYRHTIEGMKRVAVFLEQRQLKKLKALARKQDRPWAWVLRRAIDFYLNALEGEETDITHEPAEAPPERVPRIAEEQMREIARKSRG